MVICHYEHLIDIVRCQWLYSEFQGHTHSWDYKKVWIVYWSFKSIYNLITETVNESGTGGIMSHTYQWSPIFLTSNVVNWNPESFSPLNHHEHPLATADGLPPLSNYSSGGRSWVVACCSHFFLADRWFISRKCTYLSWSPPLSSFNRWKMVEQIQLTNYFCWDQLVELHLFLVKCPPPPEWKPMSTGPSAAESPPGAHAIRPAHPGRRSLHATWLGATKESEMKGEGPVLVTEGSGYGSRLANQ